MGHQLGRLSGSLAIAALLGATGAAPIAERVSDLTAGTPVAQVAPAPGLEESLDKLLADPRLNGGHAGLVVRDATTGAVVYSRNGDRRFTPGSNEKLLTSAAAAELLGLDHRFRTTVSHDGTRLRNVITGNLYLKGTGDPTLTAAAMDDLAGKVAATGIKTVRGGLVADDTWFDRVRLGTEWAWDDEPFAYAAQISALTVAANDDYDTGAIRVDVAPGAAAGAPATVSLAPATTYVRVVNEAVTGAAGSPRTIAVDRQHGANTIVVTGSVPLGSAVGASLRTVDEPTGYAAAVFRAALARRGVDVIAATRFAGTPAAVTPVTFRDSAPLGQIMTPFLKLSNNGHAEILVKAIGRKTRNQGTWSAGLQSISGFLAGAGVDAPNLRMVEGSGLSRQDLVTPDQLTQLLRNVQSRPWFATWYAALPVAGHPDRLIGGTLRTRMAGTAAANNLRGKTGTLTSVSALSGYVTDAAGRKLVFSMLTKDFLGAAPKTLEDSVGVTLANSGGSPAAAKRDLARLPKQRQPSNDPATRIDERSLECSWIKAC
jgi:D-alanyl-D-alanine carboxypeptidase/D-alanyl-D-alanine-endopeptidase (penicillin-binding protein 4)